MQKKMEGYLVEVVTLAQLCCLLPAVVATIQVGSNTAELNQLMALQLLSKLNVIKIIIRINAGTQTLVVFLLHQNLVQSLIDSLHKQRKTRRKKNRRARHELHR